MKKRDQHEKNNVCSNRGSSTDRLSFRLWGAVLFSTDKHRPKQPRSLKNTNQSATELVKNLYNSAYTGEMPQQVQGLAVKLPLAFPVTIARNPA
ncbi:hypothetical protein J41TS8_27200 [Bacillus sp. J41TS8]|nr:hypothetical protein [Bacillus paralicheniformis]GIN77679.1 hypothetical protein J41TS8_27200 [Bacillus sp. J41TS8]